MIDKHAFRTLSYGLYIVSALDDDGRRVGCVVNTFAQVASEPPTVSVSLNKDNFTTQCIQRTGKFCVAVLAQTATMELIGKFGFHTSTELDKFEETDFELCGDGVPVVTQDSVAKFGVDVGQTIDVGTHLVFIGKVHEAQLTSEGTPLTYAYYHEVLRGKTPPKAASFNGGDEGAQPTTGGAGSEASGEKRYGWRCTLCGYVVEMDELPDDFKCPICGVDKSFFERVEL